MGCLDEMRAERPARIGDRDRGLEHRLEFLPHHDLAKRRLALAGGCVELFQEFRGEQFALGFNPLP
ncbi:hypothetical protein D3C87_1978770 [compost metagenome]